MTIKKQVDSKGATRWIRRAERLARAIQSRSGVKRNIIDGYLVEGQRVGRNRRARVIDLPGRFVPYGGTTVASVFGVEAPWPDKVTAPTRRMMLEAPVPEEDDGTTELPFNYDPTTGRQITAHVIGTAPQTGLRSLGISTPQPSPGWIVQVRTVQPSTDPVPSPSSPSGTSYLYRYYTRDQRSVSNVWVVVDAWGVGNNPSFVLMIHDGFIESVFGHPVLRKDWSDWSTQGSDTRAWATVISPTQVAVAVWLSDGIPAGEAGSLGVMVFEWVEDDEGAEGWGLVFSHHIANDDMPHPLFHAHYRMSWVTGEPIVPEERSFMALQSVSMTSDGVNIIFLATLYHQLDVSVAGGARYEPTVVTGLLRLEVGLEGYGVSSEITSVNVDTALSDGAGSVTSNGVSVEGAIDYPWGQGEWVVYCSAFFDGKTLHEIVGLIRGERTNTEYRYENPQIPQSATTIYRHRYIESPTRIKTKTTTYVEDDVQVESSDILTDLCAWDYYVLPGEPIMYILQDSAISLVRFGPVYGGARRASTSSCGLGVYEIPMQQPNRTTTRESPFRVDTIGGDISEVPFPVDSLWAVSTCYAASREVEQGGEDVVIPARTLLTYRQGGGYVIELRSGDDILATTGHLPYDYQGGVYYTGNPFARMRYGRMGEYDA